MDLKPLFLCAAVIFSPLDALAESIEQAVQEKYPAAKVITQSPCNLGTRQEESFGLLLQAPDLVAVIGKKEKDCWQLTELPKKIQSSAGSDSDFLGEFRNTPVRAYEIRCANLQNDKDINARSNGEFAGVFESQQGIDARHLCFQASAVYNSWACFSVNSGTNRIETSFVQLNAD